MNQTQAKAAQPANPDAKSEEEKNLPDALVNFDRLPDTANVRLPVVRALLGCSTSSIWRMSADGRIPAPKKLSTGITAWNVGELRKVLAS